MRNTPETFWARVNRGPYCWEWVAAKTGRGYGWVMFHGRQWTAHRLAWTLTHGTIPAGAVIRHKCDNPVCCNPDHLETGTHKQNYADCRSRGRDRKARGSQLPGARLTEAMVVEIRRCRKAGTPLATLASRFGVSIPTVSAAARKRTWAHVPDPY